MAWTQELNILGDKKTQQVKILLKSPTQMSK